MKTIECKYSPSGAILYCCCDKSVETFVIPDNVTRISSGAFADCYNLKQIVFPGKLKKIEDGAFKMCKSLEEIDLSSSKLKEMGCEVFSGCSVLKKAALPDTLETIPSLAFAGCTSLSEIRLPGKLKRIESSAFCGCAKLETVNIPAPVETIGNNAFEKCTSLQRLDLSHSRLNHISPYTFTECLNLQEILLPNGLTTIQEGAFKDCINLTYTDTSRLEQLETIEKKAFWNCRNLNLVLPETLTELNGGLYGLKSIDISQCPNFTFGADDGILYNICKKTLVYAPETFSGRYSLDGDMLEDIEVYCIEPYAFYRCAGLTSIDIWWINSIGEYAFAECPNLKYIQIEDVSTFGKSVFSECGNLRKAAIKISDDEFYNSICIPEEAFSKCSNLEEIQIPETVSEIGERAFYECSSLTEINIPYELTKLGEAAFYGCSSLKQLLLYCKVTYIPFYAFACCDRLKRVLLPECVHTIGRFAFFGCSELSHVNLPEGLYHIAEQAFFRCWELEITIPASVEKIEPGALALIKHFSVDPANKHYVCDDFGALFKADVWSFEKNCRLYSLAAFPYSYKGEYVIPENVKAIQGMAFFGCSNLSGVIEIKAPLYFIGKMAFSGCTSLTLRLSASANAGEDVHEPGNDRFWTSAFGGVREIIISDRVDYFYYDRQGALHSRNRGRIKYLPPTYSGKYTVGGNPERIYTGCFDGNIFLTEVELPQSVQSIDPYAFANCYQLKSVKIPKSAGPLIIDHKAFANCVALTEVILPDNIICIAPDAFAGAACEEQIKKQYGQFIGNSRLFISCNYRSWEEVEQTRMVNLRKKIHKAFQKMDIGDSL